MAVGPVTRHVGVFGGTFDPVHLGHLRSALELLELMRLDEMLLIPCGVPPHRGAPATSAAHRLAMLNLALEHSERLGVDGRECLKSGVSYTFDTLSALRLELGVSTAISLCVGADAFLTMDSWHCWERLPELAHIVVVARPGWHLPDNLGALERWRRRTVLDGDALWKNNSGSILFVSLTPMDISATAIRNMILNKRSPEFLLPDSVWRYIREQGLYNYSKRAHAAKF